MANEEMIQKHLDNFLAKIAGETPVDDTIQNSTEFWINKIAEQGGGGSEVIANPTLSGTEDDLTAIEIDGTKYKVPKGSYIAEMADSSHITQESLAFIVANFNKIPCFVIYDNMAAQITFISNDELVSGCVGYSYDTGSFDVRGIVVKRSNRQCSSKLGKFRDVTANPSVSSSDEPLTSIKIRNTNYKIRDGATHGLGYLTTAPTAANTDGIKIVVLSSEPATKYNGYLYIILA